MAKHCGKCLHLDVCKTADSCDGHVPRCKYFLDKESFSACFGLAPWTCQLGSEGCNPDGGCRSTKACVHKIFTHADQLRAMSNKGLAKFLAEKFSNQHVATLCSFGATLRATEISEMTHTWFVAWMQWLQEPAGEVTT